MIQHNLIRFLLKPLAEMMQRFSEKTRERLFIAAGLAIFVMNFLYSGLVIQWRYLYTYVICCIFLGIMVLCSLSPDIKPVRLRGALLLPMLGAGAFMLLSGLINNVEYMPEAMLILVAYPVLYICWGNMEREKVICRLIRIVRISGYIFLSASFLLIQIKSRKYGGLFNNVNSCACYLALVCACLVTEILDRRKLDWRCAGDILLFGACMAMNFYTNSRTGMLAVYVFSAAGIVLYLITHTQKERLQCVVRGLCCVLVSVVMIHSLVYVFQLRALFPIPYYEKESRTFYFTPAWQARLFPDEGNGDETQADTALLDSVFGLEDFNEVNEIKSDTEGKTLDSYSTGRVGIWKTYASDLNLFGHPDIPPTIIKNSGGRYVEIRTTHMTILAVAYKSGLFAGICFVILNIASGSLAIYYGLKNRGNRYTLFPLVITLAFGVCSVLESIDGSFSYMSTLYYYFALFPLITAKSQKEPVSAPADGQRRNLSTGDLNRAQ